MSAGVSSLRRHPVESLGCEPIDGARPIMPRNPSASARLAAGPGQGMTDTEVPSARLGSRAVQLTVRARIRRCRATVVEPDPDLRDAGAQVMPNGWGHQDLRASADAAQGRRIATGDRGRLP